MFELKKILAILLLPPLAPVLMTLVGLLILRWKPRAGKTLAWTGVAFFLFFSCPLAVRHFLLTPLEDYKVPEAQQIRQAQAIVVLGGGKRDFAPEFGGETLNHFSLQRVRYAARLAKSSALPVLVSGGLPRKGKPEAVLMREALEQEFGIPVRWSETSSRNTTENAAFAANVLLPLKVRRILLVTDAVHMRRAVAEFEQAGFEVVPAPTAFLGGNKEQASFQLSLEFLPHIIPNATAALRGEYAMHEWLGYWVFKLRTLMP